MKKLKYQIVIVCLLFSCTNNNADKLIEVKTFKGVQVTGITITNNDRLFANAPRWRPKIPYSVVEIFQDGSVRPYPDTSWNFWSDSSVITKNRFVCVQSVVAHNNELWVLDTRNPYGMGVIDSATIYVFDLISNNLKQKFSFDSTIAPRESYLNDLVVNDKDSMVYITESGMGAIIVLNSRTGKVRRILDDHKSTKAEDVILTIDGNQWTPYGIKPQIHSDGIALDKTNGYLYYHSLTGYHLFRIPVSTINDFNLTSTQISNDVEDLGITPAPDGMIFDISGKLYFGDLESNSIFIRMPDNRLDTLIHDEKIKWPDGFTIDRNGYLYFSNSRINEAMGNIDSLDFAIYKYSIKK